MTNSEPRSVSQAIRNKRAVRAYTNDPVPDDIIEAIIDAGRRAQSAKNSQPWSFILIRDKEQLQRISTAGNFASHIPQAAFLVVLAGTPGYEFDLGQAAANMQLVAVEHGVGSCVTTLHHNEVAHSVLGLPDELQCRWSIAFGYPAEAPRPARTGGRKPLSEVLHYERW